MIEDHEDAYVLMPLPRDDDGVLGSLPRGQTGAPELMVYWPSAIVGDRVHYFCTDPEVFVFPSFRLEEMREMSVPDLEDRLRAQIARFRAAKVPREELGDGRLRPEDLGPGLVTPLLDDDGKVVGWGWAAADQSSSVTYRPSGAEVREGWIDGYISPYAGRKRGEA